MNQLYLTCKLGLTPQCPSITHPSMGKLLAPIMEAGKPLATFDSSDLEAIDKLCSVCNSFTLAECKFSVIPLANTKTME